MVTTSRRIDELQQQCRDLKVPFDPMDGREALMDRLRAAFGSFDPTVELDPMKSQDLKKKIAWGTDNPFDGIKAYLTDRWIAEPKLDGARMRLFLGSTGNTMNTGRRSVKTFRYSDRTENFPHLATAVVPHFSGTVLDGEILAPTGKIQTHTGTWTNSLLNASVALVNSNPLGSQQTQKKFGKAQFWVFDMMMFNGEDITHLPYDDRRKMLEMVIQTIQELHPDCEIQLVPQLPAAVESITAALEQGFEGVMLKLRTGTYQYGKRSSNWQKVKTFSTADAFVMGWAAGENANTGKVGSLDLGVIVREVTEDWIGRLPENHFLYDYNGVTYLARAVAQVGNLIHEWRTEISAPDGSLKPEYYGLVIEFLAQGLGKNGRARHSHMVRIRTDKTPQDCTVDQLDNFPAV